MKISERSARPILGGIIHACKVIVQHFYRHVLHFRLKNRLFIGRARYVSITDIYILSHDIAATQFISRVAMHIGFVVDMNHKNPVFAKRPFTLLIGSLIPIMHTLI